MAVNALGAQIRFGAEARSRLGAGKVRDLVTSLITAAAFTNEALALASEGMGTLRPLAIRVGAPSEMLARVSKLCSGKHPAANLLKRARNKVGFHWDEEVVKQSLLEYGRNQTIIWIESNADFSDVVHRLAVEVMGHALFFEAGSQEQTMERRIEESASHIDAAMRLVQGLFTASLYGYLKELHADHKERDIGE